MQRFWVQSFPDPGRRRIKWRPADRVGYETRYSPLSLRVTPAIVRLVVVTVTLASVTGVPLMVSVMLSLEGGGFALMEKESVSCPPSVGVAVAVDGEN